MLWCSSYALRQNQIPSPVRIIGDTSVSPISSVRGLVWGSTSTPTSQWPPTLTLLSEPVLQHCSRYGACDVHRQRTLCWRYFVHSSSAKLTVAAQCDRLQSVLNAAARLVFLARQSEHVTPLCRDLLWLEVQERIKLRLCVLTHQCPLYVVSAQDRDDTGDPIIYPMQIKIKIYTSS